MGLLALSCVMSILNSNGPSTCLGAQEEKQTNEGKIELPTDNNTPIIVYDTTGGYGVKDPEGFKPEPMLQIFPDGRVVAGRNNPKAARSQWKMPADDLQKLLQRIVRDREFFETSSDDIAQQIKATGKRVLLADASTSEITVNLPQGNQTVSVYAVSFAAKQFRQIDPLVFLAATNVELMELRHRASLGTDEQAASLLSEINEAFAEEFPGVGKFTVSDLQSAYKRSEGALTVSLKRDFKSQKSTRSIRATFKQDSGEEEPKIKFYQSKR